MTRTEVVLRNLVNKLNAMSQDPKFTGVFTMTWVHGIEYDGPTWEKELKEAEYELANLDFQAGRVR